MAEEDRSSSKKRIVVVGNGMVGHKFLEKITEFDKNQKSLDLTVFGEEKYLAYDRVQLTSYFKHFSSTELEFETEEWYSSRDIKLYTKDPVVHVDTVHKQVQSQSGRIVPFDELVLATGSVPYSPPIPGTDNCAGIYVYRTISDLDDILSWSKAQGVKHAIVLGGGLLGLEAAQVCKDLPGVESVRLVHRRPYLMNRQLDPTGGETLGARIVSQVGCLLSLSAHITNVISKEDEQGKKKITGVELTSTSSSKEEEKSIVPCDMLILSVGIRPRDELARNMEGVQVAEGGIGGVIVNDLLQSSHESVHAIGECTNHRGMTYGLVAPGYEMADVLARKFTGHETQKSFQGGDESTKLKLLGVDVASLGKFSDSDSDPKGMKSLRFHDPFSSIYRRLFFNVEGTLLLGGILVGDASDYAKLLMLCRGNKTLKVSPSELILPPSSSKSSSGSHEPSGDIEEMSPEDKVCSCNDVTKGDVCTAIHEKGCDTMGKIQSCTKAGAGCGACKPLVEAIMKVEFTKAGKKVTDDICAHFGYNRKQLFDICKIKGYKSFDELHKGHGRNSKLGCEVCKPAVASILASLVNAHVLSKEVMVLQDTNDRFLANIQRGGTYSVVPRIPGGEITPEKLIVIGEVAKKFGLYTKITGGQRIDLFGARREQLPEIWEMLVKAGFESGHAYGKSLRTVKSCVGSTWCRYGMLDSVGMAIRLEERYKGVRCPHKIKFAVSGCSRDCAEMHNKDVGLVATSNGYDILVCGNGGMKPRLGDVFIQGVSEDRAIQLIDRFFMYYIMTADRLQRTARWLEKFPGGIKELQEIIIDDKLKIAEELETRMAYLVSTYQDEWKTVVEDPEKRSAFQQFINTSVTQEGIEYVDNGRGQKLPAPWPENQAAYPKIQLEILEEKQHEEKSAETEEKQQTVNPLKFERSWVKLAKTIDVPKSGGVTILYGLSQIALFEADGKYYATQNVCPHRNSPNLSSGIIGEFEGVPKVACPVHKKTYSLETGKGLDGNTFNIATFPVKVEENQDVYILLPEIQVLDKILSTEKLRVKKDLGCAPTCSDEKLEW